MLMIEISTALISVTFNVTTPATVAAIQLHEGKSTPIEFQFSSPFINELSGHYRFIADRPDVANIIATNIDDVGGGGNDRYDFEINPKKIIHNNDNEHQYRGQFIVKGNFLGYCHIELQKRRKTSESIWDTIINSNSLRNNYQLIISIIRDKDLISKIFIYSVAIVVSISYINMGCALDLQAVSDVLRRPIAPAIGLFSQYFCMPLISFALATLLFEETYLKLGIFIFGCSPGGGASNMWTVLVNGNLNLSITMTFLSTMLSIGLMPFWLYTIGRSIFEGTSTSPPFRNIFTTLFTMVIFLGIGLLIKQFLPRVAAVSRRILAPFSGIMIIFIIVFGTYANFYMFKLMTWQMLVAAAINVWCGMFFGFILAYMFRKPLEDMLTIAIETGVQNTGVSIVVLGLSLGQPDADLASAVPVAASIMTPIPLTIAWLVMRKRRFMKKNASGNEIYVNGGVENHVNFGDGKNSEPNSLVSSSTISNHSSQFHQIYKLNLDDEIVEKNTTCSVLTNSNSSDSSQYSSKANLKI